MKKIVCLNLILFLALSLTGCHKQEVDLTKGIGLKCEGLEGNGEVSVVADELISSLNEIEGGKEFAESLDFVIENPQQDTYKNGDTVEIKVIYDQDLAEELKYEIVSDSIKLEANGFKEKRESLDQFTQEELAYIKNKAATYPRDSFKEWDDERTASSKEQVQYSDEEIIREYFVKNNETGQVGFFVFYVEDCLKNTSYYANYDTIHIVYIEESDDNSTGFSMNWKVDDRIRLEIETPHEQYVPEMINYIESNGFEYEEIV